MAWNISKAKRQALVKLQLRDKDGRFIEMGGGVKWYSSRLKKVVAGTVVGSKGENALVRLNKENPTHEPALVTVPARSIQVVDSKATLSPKGEPSVLDTPEFEKPEAVADVEADPDAEANSDHESQLKGPQHLAANYGITETSDGNTYITRNDGESIYSPARSLKVGDELISPAGADPTKPFSIGRGWATKGTERLNKDGEGPVIGKVIAISENRYAVVQMAGGHTIEDRRNPGEQTDTVTVGLSNQVILATMGLKDALGDRVSSQQYAERPDTEEKEVAPDAPEAQSDHEGREVPEDQLGDEPAAPESDPEAPEAPETPEAVEAPVEDAPEAPEKAPEADAPAEEAPAAPETPSNDIEELPEDESLSDPAEEEVPEQAKATPVNDIVDGLAELEQAAEDIEDSGLEDEEAEEVLNGASFGVVGNDGAKLNVTAEKDENGDWNFVVADENGAEIASHIIGSEENRVLAEKIAKGSSAPAKEEAAPAEEAAPEAPAAPAEVYDENGLTEEEAREAAGAMRMANRAYDRFDPAAGDRYAAMADAIMKRGEERNASKPADEAPAPAEKPEKAPESAPEPEKAPEVTPEASKPVEDVPAPSLVEPDTAPETPDSVVPAKVEPFGISYERRADGNEHAVATRPEAFTPEEAEEFRKLDIDLIWAQHENRSGREATARGKLNDLARRVQSRLDSESFSRESGDDGSAKDSVEKVSPKDSSEDSAKESPKETPEEAPEAEKTPESAPEEAPEAEEAPESAPKTEATPEEPIDSEDEPTPLTDEEMGDLRERLNGPSINEDGLLPDEAARLTDLETRLMNSYSPNHPSDEPVEPLEKEINEILEHGEARQRGDSVGPFVATEPVSDSNSAPEATPEADVAPEQAPESPEVAPEAPAAPSAPRARARRGEAVPVADADGNMITRGDKVGHPTLGPVEIVNTIPGSGRIEFIDPNTGRKKSVKAANVRKIDANAAPAETEAAPEAVAPGDKFIDAATGKKGFIDKDSNRVLVGDRVVDADGNEGVVKSVYTAANGGAWIPVKWDSDGKVRRVMGAQLTKSDSSTPEAAPSNQNDEIAEPALPDVTSAPAPEAAPEAESHETATARRQALIDSVPVGSQIASDDDSQHFYKVSETQWQFNEGALLTPIGVGNMMALGERRGMKFSRAEGGPAIVNLPKPKAVPEEPAVAEPQAPAGTTLSPEERERRIGMLRQLPAGTTVKPRSGEYTLTKEGSDNWSSTVDDGVYDTEDVYGIVESGRAGGLLYEVTRPTQGTPAAPEAPAPVALAADSLVPPTVASRLEAFRRAPIGTTVTSPAGTTTYTKAADDEWTNPDISGATIKNSTLAIATDSDNGYWIFNKTGPAEPKGTNITAMPATDKLRAFRQAPIGSKLISTNGKVITKTEERLWVTDNGTEYSPADLVFVTAPAQSDISGPFGLVLPEAGAVDPNRLPTDRAMRENALDSLPVGSVVKVRQFTFTKTGNDLWSVDDDRGGPPEEDYTNEDVARSGTEADPGVVVPATPRPIPQDLGSRVRVSEEAPIGTVVTSSSGESYTKINDREWADTATGNFKYGVGEFASKLKNNEYTGDYFVQGFDVPDITPDITPETAPDPTGGRPRQIIPVDPLSRINYIQSAPVGATIFHAAGRVLEKKGPNRWEDQSTGEDLTDEDVYTRARGIDGWYATLPPEPEAEPVPVINPQLPVGAFVPSAVGSTSGVKRVGDDKWEMIKDGEPTGRFVNDEAVSVIQELVGTDVDIPIDPRFGENVGMYADDLKLPGGKSLGQFVADGGSFSSLTGDQRQAIQAGYDRFLENLNNNLPRGFSAKMERPISFSGNVMTTKVAFYKGARKLGAATRHFMPSTDSRTGQRMSGVDHAYFTLTDSTQGSGVSSVFLNASKQMYRQMGLDRISIHADISVGGYAWARGGFDFSSASSMRSAIEEWEQRMNWNIPAGREEEWREGLLKFRELKARATAENFLNKTHPAAIEFANIGRPEGPTSSTDTWFGKAMMLGSDWYGDFPLNPNG